MTTQTTFTKKQLQKRYKKELQTLCKKHDIAITTPKKGGKGRRVLKKAELIDKLLVHPSVSSKESPVTSPKVSIAVQTDGHDCQSKVSQQEKATAPANVSRGVQKDDHEDERPVRVYTSWQDDLLEIVKEKGIADMIIRLKSQMEMKMYKLTLECYDDVSYDYYDSFIIAAHSEVEARETAAEYNERGRSTWMSETASSIELIAEKVHRKEPEIISSSFNAG
jgi:hypothetical protein